MEGQPPHCPNVVWLAHLSQSWSGNQSGSFSEGLCIDTHTSSVQGAMMTFTPVRLLLHRLPTFKASLATGVSHSRCVRPRLLWLPSCVKLEWQHHSTRFEGVGLSGTSSSHGKGHPTPPQFHAYRVTGKPARPCKGPVSWPLRCQAPHLGSAENSHGFMRRPWPPQKA